MAWRRTAAALVGAVATLFGLAVLAAPVLLDVGPGAWLGRRLADIDPVVFVLAGALLVAIYLVLAARRRSTPDAGSPADRRFETLVAGPPEVATADGGTVAGAAIDDDLAVALESGGDSLARIRSRLSETAITVYADAAGVSEDRAATLVERGEWTRDATAARFLSGADGPRPPPGARVRLWLMPERERWRRVERTLAAIESLRSDA